MSLRETIRSSQLWKSIFRHPPPVDRRNRVLVILSNLVLHLHPRVVPADALRLPRTFALGGASLVLFLLLAATGALLLTAYEPSPERAYGTVTALVDDVRFGAFVRSVHHWAANGLVLVTLLHLLRVVYRGGHLPPRQGNWLVGVALLLLVVACAFTGYLLPWDQLAYWAITVGTNIASAAPVVGSWLRFVLLGGTQIDQNTLIRFYVLHCFLLPTVVLLLFSWHMWRVRKDGGLACVDHLVQEQKRQSVVPAKSKTYSLLGVTRGRTVHVETTMVDEDAYTVPSSPNLTRRLLVVLLGTLLVTSLLAVVAHAPLEEAANPGLRAMYLNLSTVLNIRMQHFHEVWGRAQAVVWKETRAAMATLTPSGSRPLGIAGKH